MNRMNYNLHMHLVPYQQSIYLKELDFNEPCNGYYNETGEWIPDSSEEGMIYSSNGDLRNVSAPSFIQAFSFFRKKGYETKVEKESEGVYVGKYLIACSPNNIVWMPIKSGSHKEAEIACLDYLINVSFRSELQKLKQKLKTNEHLR